MKKYLLLIVALAVALSLTSCRRVVEKAREKIRVEAIEAIESHGLSGFDAVVRLKNGTGYKLRLETAEVELFYDSRRIGDVALREPVEVARRTTVSVETQWRLRISDPLALYVLSRRLQQGELSQISVSFVIKGRGGPAKVDISQQMLPLSQVLNIFGLKADDLKNYLK